jgi:hypothetical protein
MGLGIFPHRAGLHTDQSAQQRQAVGHAVIGFGKQIHIGFAAWLFLRVVEVHEGLPFAS